MRRTIIVLAGLVFTAALAGCGEPQPSSFAPGEDGNLVFENDYGDNALAVGAYSFVEVRTSASTPGRVESVEDVVVESPEVFEVSDVDGRAFSIEAVGQGSAQLRVVVQLDDGTTRDDRFILSAKSPESVELFISRCQDTDTLLADQVYGAEIFLYAADEPSPLVATGMESPLYGEPSQLVSISDEVAGIRQVDLVTAPEQTGGAEVFSTFDDSLVRTLSVVEAEAADELDIYFQLTGDELRDEPFEEDWEQGEAHVIAAEQFTGNERICGASQFLFQSLTPDVCELYDPDDSGQNNPATSHIGEAVRMKTHGVGDCLLQVDQQDVDPGEALSEQFETTSVP